LDADPPAQGVKIARRITPLVAQFPRPTEDLVLAALVEPKTAIELRNLAGVTRQRIEQILRRLVEANKVLRNEIAGERGQHIYIRSDVDYRDSLLLRSPSLMQGRARALSTLAMEVHHQITDVAHLLQTSRQMLVPWFAQLSAQGLVSMFKLTQHQYVALTPRGFSHPQYDIQATKAPAADIVSDIGERRVRFLQVISVIGPLRTIDITYALPEGYFDDVEYSSGQIVQRLIRANLIELVSRGSKKASAYQLTSKGTFTTAILNRVLPPPLRDELLDRISARRKKRAEKQRSLPDTFGSPAQEAAVRALQRVGLLTRTEIHELMEVKFSNPASLDLALRILEKRGVVKVAVDPEGRILKRGKARLWQAG
jgi:DNA-binding MarR family transcriptional regulator